jgi:hypothetical protein
MFSVDTARCFFYGPQGGYITEQGLGGTLRALDRPHRLYEMRLSPAAGKNVCAQGGKFPGNGGTDSPPAAGYNGHLAFQGMTLRAHASRAFVDAHSEILRPAPSIQVRRKGILPD